MLDVAFQSYRCRIQDILAHASYEGHVADAMQAMGVSADPELLLPQQEMHCTVSLRSLSSELASTP